MSDPNSQSAAYTSKRDTLTAYARKESFPIVLNKDGQEGVFLEEAVTLAALVTFFEKGLGEAGLIHVLPEEEHLPLPLEEVSLRGLSLTPDLGGPGYIINFTIAWDDHSHDISAGFTLKEISAVFMIGGSGVQAMLAATLTVHDVPLAVQIALPGLIIQAFLAPDQLPDDGQGQALLDKFVPSLPAGDKPDAAAAPASEAAGDEPVDVQAPAPKTTSLRAFRTMIALRQKRFMIHLEVAHLLQLGPFDLALAQLDLTYDGGAGGKPAGMLLGEIDIDLGLARPPLVVTLEADYDGAGNWQFSGGIGPQGLKLSDLVGALAAAFDHEPPGLPEFLHTLEIRQLNLRYDTSQEKFDFDVELKFDVTDSGPLVDVIFRYTNKGAEGGPDESAIIIIDDREFDLIYEKAKRPAGELSDETGDAAGKEEAEDAEAAGVDAGSEDAAGEDAASAGVGRETAAQDGAFFIATYKATDGSDSFSLRKMVGAITHDKTVHDLTPPLTIAMKDVLFAYMKQGGQSRIVFGLALDSSVELKDLPLVGSKLAGVGKVGLDDLQILFATAPFSPDDLNAVNDWLPDEVAPLPVPQSTGASAKATLNKGLNFSANLNFGPLGQMPVDMGNGPGTSGDGTMPPAALPAPTATVAPDPTQWLSIQKSLGPVFFEQVGLRYQDGQIWVLLSGSVTFAGLSLGLIGLGISSPLDKFHPSFHLQGLAVDFREGPLEVGGAFMHYRVQDLQGKFLYDEYDGIVTVKFEEFGLSAIGSYAHPKGEQASLFLYLALKYPLGGPPFFFVTGLSGGFGFNRNIIVPPAEQLRSFPLVSEVIDRPATSGAPGSQLGAGSEQSEGGAQSEDAGDGSAEDGGADDGEDKGASGRNNMAAIQNQLQTELESLRQYLPVDEGEYWLAAGISFTSFELLKCFAMLTIAFGKRFEIDILGIVSLVVPPAEGEPEPPLVNIEIGFTATFAPDDGFLGLRAVLTPNSYLFEPPARLTGGVAFYSWFKDDPRDPNGYKAGDFVATVGGYHPKFKLPSFYPRVPRIGLNWRYSDKLSVKGGYYYALTGHAIMAGGNIEATFQSESIKAWIKAGADFLIAWKPFHYEVDVYVEIGAEVTIHFLGTHRLSVSLSANLAIWGPKFAGRAKLHIWVASFEISFGGDKKKKPPLEWAKFRESFLPAGDGDVLTLAAAGGLARSLDAVPAQDGQPEQPARWIMNPRQFNIIANSAVPATTVDRAGKKLLDGKAVGIAPMKVTPAQYGATMDFTVTREVKGKKVNASGDFTAEPVTKNVPAGLWGEKYQAGVNDKSTIPDVLSGFKVVPAQEPTPGVSHDIERRNLAFETEQVPNAFRWEASWQPPPEAQPMDARAAEGGTCAITPDGAALLSCFGLAEPGGQLAAEELLLAPEGDSHDG